MPADFASSRVYMRELPALGDDARIIHAYWVNGPEGIRDGKAKFMDMSVKEYCHRYGRKVGSMGWPVWINALDIAATLYVNFGPKVARDFCSDKLGAHCITSLV